MVANAYRLVGGASPSSRCYIAFAGTQTTWFQSVLNIPLIPVLRNRDVYPRSRIRIFSSRFPDPNIFHPGSRKYDPGCSSRIRILIFNFYPSRIPDPWVKKAPDPQHCLIQYLDSCECCRRKPELVVFTEMVATSRTYIRGLTLVSQEWLSESQEEYFRYFFQFGGQASSLVHSLSWLDHLTSPRYNVPVLYHPKEFQMSSGPFWSGHFKVANCVGIYVSMYSTFFPLYKYYEKLRSS